jgi:hypothetical protein
MGQHFSLLYSEYYCDSDGVTSKYWGVRESFQANSCGLMRARALNSKTGNQVAQEC